MGKNKNDLKHIHKDQLSERIQEAMDNNGFSIYKGVLVVWDSVQEKKLLEVLDNFIDAHPNKLLAVHFADNLLEMIWKDNVPTGLGPRVTDTEQGRIELDPSAYIIPVMFK